MLKVNKKHLTILAFICILFLIPSSFASDIDENNTLTDNVIADSDSIYVSLDGDDEIADGSVDNPYQSISKAIENYDSVKNSNIYIKNGSYIFNEQVTVNKDVTIVGESNEGVIFDGADKSAILKIQLWLCWSN